MIHKEEYKDIIMKKDDPESNFRYTMFNAIKFDGKITSEQKLKMRKLLLGNTEELSEEEKNKIKNKILNEN